MRPDPFAHAVGVHPRRKIAVVGGGIAGNTAAWALSRTHQVTLYEAEPKFGGHSNTATVPLNGVDTPVDTGFIVYNLINYPNLIRLFDHLGVATEWSDMSFGISLDDGKLEYRSDKSFSALLARKRNALSPRFVRMLLDLTRFYKTAPGWMSRPDLMQISFGDLLRDAQVTQGFIDDHIIPMAACIWSASYNEILEFPAASFLRFFQNHGLFQLNDRPRWRTVTGGSRQYVDKLIADIHGETLSNAPVTAVERLENGVRVHAKNQPVRDFDDVLLACHADTALKLIHAPTVQERSVLSAFRYSKNTVLLHKDKSAMPLRKGAWSSWNYVAPRALDRDATTPVTYWMNSLQNLKGEDVFVSLNPQRRIDERLIHSVYNYEHPIYDRAAFAAQSRLREIQGADRLWFAGSYFGYGFHEDACASGLATARLMGGLAAWDAPANDVDAALVAAE
jgi:uncharacterized protein